MTNLSAQEPNCSEVAALAEMAKARSTSTLIASKRLAGKSYKANVVFEFRSFERNLSDRGQANRVLNLIPQTDEQDSVWHSFGDLVCPTETIKDVTALARLQARLPHDLAKAVLIRPEMMLAYVSYAYTSVQDPDSDFAVQMCRAKHREFMSAVDGLSRSDKAWFVSRVFNPDGCRALALPEAD